jgi:hypothetical protein
MPNTDVSPKQGVVGSRNSVVTVPIPSKRHTITSNILLRAWVGIAGQKASELRVQPRKAMRFRRIDCLIAKKCSDWTVESVYWKCTRQGFWEIIQR